MITTDLRPASEIVLMRPEDTWVFQFLFRKIEDGNPVNLDVSAFDFMAQLYQKIDKNWVKYPSPFSRKAINDNVNAIETGIYLGSIDPSKIVFLWDFKNATETNELSEGEYRLDFLYTTDLGYDKSFFTYFPILTNEVREDKYQIIAGVKYINAAEIVSKTVNIHNTII